MTDKYFRLVCFVVNICPEPLRDFFLKLAKDDAGTTYTDIDAYLSTRHQDVNKLKVKKRKIRQDQYDLVYPGHGTADLNQWDVTLLITLITELFASSLQPMETFFINEIRGIRNLLQHLPNTSSMPDIDFDTYWGRLDTAIMTIAKCMFNATQEDELRQKICDAKTSHLPDLGDALRIWYEETIRQMAYTIQDMQIQLDEVQLNTRETTSILRKVTVEKPGPAGDKNKRMRTTDGILARLQASFEATMKELPGDFVSPTEVTEIRTKLRDNHHVVVTGSYSSRYFETALAAITGLDYNYKRCVEMHMSSDWCHIDPEDVDLVFCKNPFGNFSYDDTKAKSMADVFNSILHTTKGGSEKSLDIVIVTDLKILTECKQYHDHDILEEVVKVFGDTTDAQPADLTLGLECQKMKPDTHNLRVMTSNFLNQYKISSSQVDEDIIKVARDQFKSKKAIVLTGPKASGKTSVAVALASSYHPSQCSLLTEPSDFKKIDFQTICLIIIDEFAGKYSYDKKDIYKWYGMFDHLYNAVTAGQMNAINSCEKSKLYKCCNEISRHPLLEHRVNMPDRPTIIKQEIVHRNTEDTLVVAGNSVGSINTSEITDTSSGVISGAFNPFWGNDKQTTTLRLPQVPSIFPTVIAQTVQNSTRFPFRTTQPAQTVSTERDTVDDVGGSIDTSTAVETRSLGISGTFNVPYRNETLTATPLALSQPSRPQGQTTFLKRAPMQTFTASSEIPSSYSRNVLPGPTLSTENGVLTDQISSIDGHQWMQRVPHTQTSISSVRGLTGSRVWSVKDEVQRNIRVNSDRNKCNITGSCLLPSGEILYADHYNRKLKKLDARYQVIGVCDLPDEPNDVCYTGNNVAVVAMTGRKLQFVDFSGGMTLTRSVDTDHYCTGLAYHDYQLYVIDEHSVYIYSTDGIKQRVLYTGQSGLTIFQQIAISDNGSLIYLAGFNGGLTTLDSSGKHLYTFTDSKLNGAYGVCVNGDGHVLVSSYSTNKIYQISSDGKQKLGIIDGIDNTKTLCFDKNKATLVAAGCSDNICVLKLQK